MSGTTGTPLPDDGNVPDGNVPDVGDASEDDALPDGLTIPDDLSSLGAADDDPVTVAIVVTQVAAAGPLAAACSLANLAIDVVSSPVGALALPRDPHTAAEAAEVISRLLKTVPVVLLERRASQITATRWEAGAQGDELPPGLVLSDAPAVLEDLLLGGVQVGDLTGVVTSVGLSRWRAMRMLASSRRGTRR